MSTPQKTDEEQEFVIWLASQPLHRKEDLAEIKRVLCSLLLYCYSIDLTHYI